MRITRRQLRRLIKEALNEQDETSREEVVERFVNIAFGDDLPDHIRRLVINALLSEIERAPDALQGMLDKLTDEYMTALDALEWVIENMPRLPPSILEISREAFKRQKGES